MIRSSYFLGRVMGIPIRVHITLLIVLPLIGMQFAPWFASARFFWGLLCAAGVFASVALHELGHSWVAIRKGCRVREIMLLPIGGVAKMVQIPVRPRDEFLVAVAGPATSALLAMLCYLAGMLFDALGAGPPAVAFMILSAVNLALLLFNLLPSFPMDGGRIFRAWITPKLGRLRATALAARIGRIMAVIFGCIALFKGNFILLLIAVFIYQAAGTEYRMAQMQHLQQEWFSPEPQADIRAGPPPYARKAPPFWKAYLDKTRDFFAGWFKNPK